MNTYLLGFAAAFSAALIGAGWQIVTRFGVTTTVDAFDLSLIRYCIPALILCPILLRKGLFPKGVNSSIVTAIVLGGGLPFGLLVMLGASSSPVSHIAVLIPGTVPIFVALLAYFIYGDRIESRTLISFLIITIGVCCVGWEAIASMGIDTVRGDMILLSAAFLWAVYSVAFRKSGLSPWHAAAIIAFWSALLAVGLWYFLHGSGFSETPYGALAIQIIWQGLLAGVIGMWIYGYAMQKIGPAQAATVGALVPALAAVGGGFS